MEKVKKNHSYTLKSKMNQGTALLALPIGYNESQAYHAIKRDITIKVSKNPPKIV